MKIKELIEYLWNGVDIPITREEIQHGVNEMIKEIREEGLKIEVQQKTNYIE